MWSPRILSLVLECEAKSVLTVFGSEIHGLKYRRGGDADD